MTVTPWYKSHAFWTTFVSAVVAMLGGIFTDGSAEIALFSSAAALVIGYLVTKGIVVKSVIESAGPRYAAGEDAKPDEVEF